MNRRLSVLLIIIVGSIVLSGCNHPWQRSAGLQVITNDLPVSVYINNQLADKTPFINKELKPGNVTIKLIPDDPTLAAYELPVILRRGLLTVITWRPGNRPETSGGVVYEMEPIKDKKMSELSLVSLPDSAIARLDNGQQEFTPILVENITPGTHTIEVSLPSYETQKHTINVISGHRMNVTVKLARISEALSQPTSTATSATESKPETSTTSATMKINNSGKTVKIISTNYFVEGNEVLKVRAQPSATAAEIGLAQVGNSYEYNSVVENGWLNISFEHQSGWISQRYAQVQE